MPAMRGLTVNKSDPGPAFIWLRLVVGEEQSQLRAARQVQLNRGTGLEGAA